MSSISYCVGTVLDLYGTIMKREDEPPMASDVAVFHLCTDSSPESFPTLVLLACFEIDLKDGDLHSPDWRKSLPRAKARSEAL